MAQVQRGLLFIVLLITKCTCTCSGSCCQIQSHPLISFLIQPILLLSLLSSSPLSPCLAIVMGFLRHLFTVCCHSDSTTSDSPRKVAVKLQSTGGKSVTGKSADIHLNSTLSTLSPIETTRKDHHHHLFEQISRTSSAVSAALLPPACLDSAANRLPPQLNLRLPDTLGEFECCQLLQSQLGLSEVHHLAEGFFSTVFAVRQSADGRLYACKAFLFGKNWTADDRLFDFRRENFTTEATLLRRLSHRHIIRHFATFQVYCQQHSEGHFHLSLRTDAQTCNYEQTLLLAGHLLELVHLNLAQWLEGRRLDGHQLRLLFDQIGSALQYLHSKHYVCHRDLKLANIGVKVVDDGGQVAISKLLLLDFGNSVTYSQAEFERAEERMSTTVAPDESQSTNPFLLEAYHFACLLMLAATFDSIWKSADDIRDNFSRQCSSTASQLDRLLLKMSAKPYHISINRAISYLGERSS